MLTLLIPASEAVIVSHSPFSKITSGTFLLYYSQQQLPADQEHLRRHLSANILKVLFAQMPTNEDASIGVACIVLQTLRLGSRMEKLPPWLRTGSNPLGFLQTHISFIFRAFSIVTRANP